VEPLDISSILEWLHNNISDAQDSLKTTKIYQAHYANAYCRAEENFQEGDFVMLSTKNCCHEYKAKNQKRSAKFFPCYNRPWKITKAYLEKSEYTLDLLLLGNIFLFFYFSFLRQWYPNDPNLFPNHELTKPGPLLLPDGSEEYHIQEIVEEKGKGAR